MTERENIKNGNENTSFRRAESIEQIINRVAGEINKSSLTQKVSELSSIQAQLDKIILDFHLIAKLQELAINKTDPPAPLVEIPEQTPKARKARFGEYGSYAASLIILIYLTYTNLDLEIWLNALIVAFFFTIITLVLPLLTGLFNVSKLNSASIKPAEIASYVLTFLAAASVLLFALFRTSEATDGISVTLFNLSMPLAEIFFALLAACCGEIKKFYNWSKDFKNEFERLNNKANGLEAEIARLSGKSSLNSLPLGNLLNGNMTGDSIKPVAANETISMNGGATVNEK